MDTLIQSLDFIDNRTPEQAMACDFKVTEETNTGKNRKLYIESYGCQMNYSDSEIVSSIMAEDGFDTTSKIEEADVIFLNTCSIREKAEKTVRDRLKQIKQYKKKNRDLQVGILGCMAERLKKSLLEEEKIVDLVVGPDAYRDLPNLINQVDEGQKAVNVLLSREETYADINPIRLNSNGISAFVSIMRGCDNMCSFCVVPFTRGRERSRDAHSVIREVQQLLEAGYKEVTLLGQNVDSYKWTSEDGSEFVNFANLLEMVAKLDKNLRVRFSTSHPKDITDEVLYTMKKYDNICKYIHLPIQSGNSRVLELMNRTYDRDWYMNRVNAIRNILGEECGISSDMIAGFCTETEEEHQDTLSMMDFVQYDYSYMFFYSERPGTLAARKLEDDIPLEIKKRRLAEIIDKQRETSLNRNKLDIGKIHKVLVEGFSKKSDTELMGRNDQNKVVVFPKKNYQPGQYVNVFVTDCSVGTLFGEAID